MYVKLLLVFVTVTAAAAEAPSQSETGILDNLDRLNEILKRLLEIYEVIQKISEIDIGEVIADLTSPEQMTKLFLYILDNYTGRLPQEYICLLRMAVVTDLRTQERLHTFLSEIVNYFRLVHERDAKTEECDSMNPSGMIANIIYQNCRLHVLNLELSVAVSHARLSYMVVALRETWAEGLSCIRK